MRGLAAVALMSPLLLSADAEHVDARACAGCHQQIFERYVRSGMDGRSVM